MPCTFRADLPLLLPFSRAPFEFYDALNKFQIQRLLNCYDLIFYCIALLFHLVAFCRLKPLDVVMMKALHDKVNIVPVIAKADTLTKKEVKKLKERVSLNSNLSCFGLSRLKNAFKVCSDEESFIFNLVRGCIVCALDTAHCFKN